MWWPLQARAKKFSIFSSWSISGSYVTAVVRGLQISKLNGDRIHGYLLLWDPARILLRLRISSFTTFATEFRWSQQLKLHNFRSEELWVVTVARPHFWHYLVATCRRVFGSKVYLLWFYDFMTKEDAGQWPMASASELQYVVKDPPASSRVLRFIAHHTQ